MRRPIHLPFLLVLAFAASRADEPPDPAPLPAPPEELRAGFGAVDEADLRAWVSFLASEELEGRETGELGYQTAARFCATLLRRFGAAPAGDKGTYFQEFTITRVEPDLAASGLELEDAAGKERFEMEGNLAAFAAGSLEWKGIPWVFAGWGGTGDEEGKPSEDFAGLPVKDLVVMVLPKADVTNRESRGAIAAGASRIAVVSDERVKSRLGLGRHEWPEFRKPEWPGNLPEGVEIAYVTRRVADRILRSKGLAVEKLLELKERPPRCELDGVTVRFAAKRNERVVQARNVVGILEGSDPVLKAEVVVVGAHLDHLGRRGAKIFPGADDDASGSAGVLALAGAFSESPRRPARSISFALFAAEEKGLWGSFWFVEHPPVPLKSIFVEIQLDMIGRDNIPSSWDARLWKPQGETVNLVGARRKSFDVDRTIREGSRYVGLELRYGNEGLFGSSDQFHFGERGIPVAFFFSGFHSDCHQTTDTAEKINYGKMARIIRLAFTAAYELADRREPLKPFRRV